MAKAFSVASWNVEHFGDSSAKIDGIVKYIADQKADVVGIYEVKSSRVFGPIMKAMPNYQFHITEGPQMQEILVAVKHGLSAYVMQKLTFQSSQTTLRPGVLATVCVAGAVYPVLFLHLKSLTDAKSMGLRDDMIYRAFKFRKALDDAAGGTGKSNYIIVGDFNTMGMKYPYGHAIAPESEIKRVRGRASYRKMRLLDKNAPHTWSNGSQSSYEPGNLDHVLAAKHLQFKSFGGAQVDVRGWPKEPTDAKKDAWIEKYSDHGLLYFEVQRV